MSLVDQVKQALQKAIERTRSQANLAQKSGVAASSINCFFSGKRDIANMTLYTFEKLFPDLRITFFRDEWPVAQSPPNNSLEQYSVGARKIAAIYDSMTEEGQLELMAQAGALRERHPKNNHDEAKAAG